MRRQVKIRLTSRHVEDPDEILQTVSETFKDDDLDIYFPDIHDSDYFVSSPDKKLEATIIASVQEALERQNKEQLVLPERASLEPENAGQGEYKKSNREWVKDLRREGISLIAKLIVEWFSKGA